MAYKILFMGASYGSLLASKLIPGGHQMHFICLPAEAELINKEGIKIRMPVKGREGLIEINSQKMGGKLSASGPAGVKPSDYDLVCLAMMEPQYRSPGVRELLDAVAKAKVPCMSIMNMAPLPYLKRIPGLNVDACRQAYADATVWDSFDPNFITLCSPDPQAFRPPDEKVNVLQVRLPTNFKAAKFASDKHTDILRALEKDVDAARFDDGTGAKIELPVKLRVHDSIWVPLAKWPMLMAGNYRCVTPQGIRPIKDAVLGNPAESKEVYNWVVKLCVSLGAAEKDMVPFEKYANAAQSLLTPSSAARALYGGAPNIERPDRLMQAIAKQKGTSNAAIDEVVKLVDAQLELNRAKAKAA